MRINSDSNIVNFLVSSTNSSNSIRKVIENLSGNLKSGAYQVDIRQADQEVYLRTRLRSINKDLDNIQEGISILQTAKSGLKEIHGILNEMEQLIAKTSSGNIEGIEAQAGMNELVEKLDSVTKSTKFDGRVLFDGTYQKQVSINNDLIGPINVSFGDLTASGLGIKGLNTGDKESSAEAIKNAMENVSGEMGNVNGWYSLLSVAADNLRSTDENLDVYQSRLAELSSANDIMNSIKKEIINSIGTQALSSISMDKEKVKQLLSL